MNRAQSHNLPLLVPLLLLAACAGTTPPAVVTQGPIPVSTLYCDSFLIYDMCAQDLDQDGVVELVYFADTSEVFLWRGDSHEHLPDNLAMHRCAQQMDDDVVNTTSLLFYIDDETDYLERVDIKSSLMFSYVNYMPRVMRCNAQYGSEPLETPAPVGDEFDF